MSEWKKLTEQMPPPKEHVLAAYDINHDTEEFCDVDNPHDPEWVFQVLALDGSDDPEWLLSTHGMKLWKHIEPPANQIGANQG